MRQINRFVYRPEEGLNPYMGVVSFQHFRGEKLYSDIVVRPENNLTETERVECYPVSEDAEEKGREQGYYPDSSVAYIRVLWKEFEPRRGEYNYKFIEDIIAESKRHGQSLIFRLMPHSTRACDDVPDWLKELIPCPQRPEGERVKLSPTDPLFVELFGEAVRKIGERFDDDPTFDAVDISLPGAWGEGSVVNMYSPDVIEQLVDTYTDVFKKTQLMGQLARPDLIEYVSEKTPTGWRGDGLGDPFHTEEYYPPYIEQLAENWKTAPVSFESYWWLGEWMRQGWDIDVIIEKTLEWHISTFNPKSMPIPYEWQEKVDYWISKMGYHFAIDYFSFPSDAVPGDVIWLELGIMNYGVAPIYRRIPLNIRLSGTAGSFEITTDVDVRSWLPGKTEERLKVTLPKNITSGVYDIEIGIYNEEIPMIYLCTDAVRKDSFYKVGEININ